MGNVSWMFFQEGRSSNLRLRRGVGQAAHARNNSHVKCTGHYCALKVNNAVTSEMCGVILSSIVGLFITTLTDCLASFKAAGHRPESRYFCRLQLGHNAATVTYVNPSTARDKHLARPLINKKK